MQVRCDCAEWASNMMSFDLCMRYAIAHGFRIPGEVKAFRRCPYCGTVLKREEWEPAVHRENGKRGA